MKLHNTLNTAVNDLYADFVKKYFLQIILQIYYDFSGYSDMAIGLGHMFGFSFDENFNYPYCASSVTDFWHRWHISLGSWFRDYVYLPLGDSRFSPLRHILNMAVVWSYPASGMVQTTLLFFGIVVFCCIGVGKVSN